MAGRIAQCLAKLTGLLWIEQHPNWSSAKRTLATPHSAAPLSSAAACGIDGMTRSAFGPCNLGNVGLAWHSRQRSSGLCFCAQKAVASEDHEEESTTFVFGLGSEYPRNWKENLVCVTTIIVNDRLQS